MLKIKIDARAKCRKHPRYDPAKDGPFGIIGGCETCSHVFGLFQSAEEFERRTAAIAFHLPFDRSHRYIAPAESRCAGSAHFRYSERG